MQLLSKNELKKLLDDPIEFDDLDLLLTAILSFNNLIREKSLDNIKELVEVKENKIFALMADNFLRGVDPFHLKKIIMNKLMTDIEKIKKYYSILSVGHDLIRSHNDNDDIEIALKILIDNKIDINFSSKDYKWRKEHEESKMLSDSDIDLLLGGVVESVKKRE